MSYSFDTSSFISSDFRGRKVVGMMESGSCSNNYLMPLIAVCDNIDSFTQGRDVIPIAGEH